MGRIKYVPLLATLTLSILPTTMLHAKKPTTISEMVPIYEGSERQPSDKKVTDHRLHTPVGAFDPLVDQEPAMPQQLRKKEKVGVEEQFILQYGEAHPKKAQEAIRNSNGKMFGYFDAHAYRIKLNHGQLARLRADPSVRSVTPVHPSYKIDPALKDASGNIAQQIGGEDTAYVAVLVFDNVAKQRLAEKTKGLGATKIKSGNESGQLMELELPLAQISALADDEDVVWIQPAAFSEPEMDDVHMTSSVFSAWNNGLNNQSVALVDSGLDVSHPAFRGKVFKVFDYGSDTASTDASGHGTMVAGIMVGNGENSTSYNKKGMAYNGNLIIQSYLTSDQWLGPSISKLMADAWGYGIRISNNSWGKTNIAPNRYDGYAREVDSFVYNHSESAGSIYKNTFLILKSAGNSQKITSPGSAKNIITVGATYNSKWGDAGSITGYSGRGPTEDGRTKPDIVAPGDGVVAPRSAYSKCVNPDESPCFPSYLGNSSYTISGGTSFATPVVSGAAALVSQYYQTQLGIKPSAALIKATLLNGTTKLGGVVAPNNTQGWGRLQVAQSLFPYRHTSYSDARVVGHQGSVEFTFDVTDPSVPLVSTLCWIDPEGDPANYSNKVTVADLDLKMYSPSGNTYSSSSTKETVEQVYLTGPSVGTWRVVVSGFDVPNISQRFALVIRGG